MLYARSLTADEDQCDSRKMQQLHLGIQKVFLKPEFSALGMYAKSIRHEQEKRDYLERESAYKSNVQCDT